MRFLLFSKIQFSVSNPIALIESYCFQSDFYSNFDLIEDRKIEDVNKIGARIKGESLKECESITNRENNLNIFKHELDSFLLLSEKTRKSYIEELCEKVVKKLSEIDGIGLSKATKVLHTLHPDLIPIIDNLLQNVYKKEIDPKWTDSIPSQILIDYYYNLKEEVNWKNLNQIYHLVLENKIPNLTKVRIFDILWWSYLKANKLKHEKNINWSTIKCY